VFAEYGVILLVAIAVAFLLQAFVVKPYRIPSPSMVPTLDPGDRVLVARFMYHFTTPAHGNIVVFKYPLDTRVVFIKRVIGLPGDTLALRNGRVYINGVVQNEPYVAKMDGRISPTQPAPPISGSTISQPWSLNRPYTVPAHTYFMMGDNRLDSDDSRVWGPVPARDLIGRAFLVYWPVTRLGLP
jgi:signal peptidase I